MVGYGYVVEYVCGSTYVVEYVCSGERMWSRGVERIVEWRVGCSLVSWTDGVRVEEREIPSVW